MSPTSMSSHGSTWTHTVLSKRVLLRLVTKGQVREGQAEMVNVINNPEDQSAGTREVEYWRELCRIRA